MFRVGGVLCVDQSMSPDAGQVILTVTSGGQLSRLQPKHSNTPRQILSCCHQLRQLVSHCQHLSFLVDIQLLSSVYSESLNSDTLRRHCSCETV